MDWDIEENGQRGLVIDGIWYCEELVVPAIANLVEDNQRLRRALAPILSHADAHDYAPPLKFSVDDCREIRDKVRS